MSIDERLEQRLTASGHDLQTDEGARVYQEQLERELESQRRRFSQQPPRQTERLRGIQI